MVETVLISNESGKFIMHAHQLVKRTLPFGACSVILSLASAPWAAPPVDKSHPTHHPSEKAPQAKPKASKAECKAAYKTGKEQEQSGRLREARDSYQSCSQTACGTATQPKCASKAALLENEIPTVVIVATDKSGASLHDVAVKVDGVLLSSTIDDRALEINPGTHEFTFSTNTGFVATQNVTVVAGQHNVRVSVTVNAAPPRNSTNPEPAKALKNKPTGPESSHLSRETPAAPDSAVAHLPPKGQSSGPGAAPFIVGGAGVAAVGAGILFNMWGRSDNEDLVAKCSPNCQQSSVDHVRSLYLTGDILIGVGVAALGVATFLYFSERHTTEHPINHAAYKIDVQPTPSGAFATISGSF